VLGPALETTMVNSTSSPIFGLVILTDFVIARSATGLGFTLKGNTIITALQVGCY
jgi:hypothetical protein